MSTANTATTRQYRGRMARSMLLMLLPLSLLPLLLVGSMAYLYNLGYLQEQAFTLLANVANSQGERIASQVETGQLLLTRSLHNKSLIEDIETAITLNDPANPEYVTARQAIFNELQTINQPKPYYNQFLIVKPDGEIHLSTFAGWQGEKITDPDFAKLVSSAPASQASFAPKPLYRGDEEIDAFTIMTAVRYIDPDGKHKATIVGIAESATIRDFIQNATFYSDKNFFITPEGQFIGVNPWPNSFNKLIILEPTGTKPLIMQNLNSGDPSAQELDSSPLTQDQPVINAKAWLDELGIGWSVEVFQESVYGQINTLLQYGSAIFLVLFLLVGVTIWLITKRITQPILELTNTVSLFADGNWEQRSMIKRQDEIGLLSQSFNNMANDLSNAYQRLETQVEERTGELHTLAQLSQIITAAPDLDSLLHNTLDLVVDRFNCDYAAAFLVEQSGYTGPTYAVLLEEIGSAQFKNRLGARKVKVDPSSGPDTLVEKVIVTNSSEVSIATQSITAATANAEYNPLIYEAGIPIATGDQVFGALNLFTQTRPGASTEEPFSNTTVSELQTLANHIASAVKNFQLLEVTQINLQEANQLYQAGHQIAQAETARQVLNSAAFVLQQTTYSSMILLADDDELQTAHRWVGRDQPPNRIRQQPSSSQKIQFPQNKVETYFPSSAPILVDDIGASHLPQELLDLPRQMGCDTVAFMPVIRRDHLAALLVLGSASLSTQSESRPSSEHRISPALTLTNLQPYANLIELVSITIEKIQAQENTQLRLTELQALWDLSQTISIEISLIPLYQVIHRQVERVLGDLSSFGIALYDSDTNRIQFPYMIEEGEVLAIEPFPLGEGLTSIVLHSGRPLMLVEDTERKAQELGSKQVGVAAKSWLGVPLLFGGKAFGAIIVQDTAQENRFTENDQQLLSTIAAQVAIALRNIRLLDLSRKQAEQERILYEITAKIRRSADIRTIMKTTADELSAALNAHRAHIEIDVAPPDNNGKEPQMDKHDMEFRS